jgi:hypothetical protein
VAEYTPVMTNGTAPWTLQASATIIGGRLVEVTGNGTVGPAGAASVKVLGVAANDAASGAKVGVWPLAGLTHKVLGTGAINAGDNLAAGAAGVVAALTFSAAGDAPKLVGVADRAAADATIVRFVGR